MYTLFCKQSSLLSLYLSDNSELVAKLPCVTYLEVRIVFP